MKEFILVHLVKDPEQNLSLEARIIPTLDIKSVEARVKKFNYSDLSEEQKDQIQGLVLKAEIGGSFIAYLDEYGNMQHDWTLESPAAIYKRMYEE